MFHVVSETKNTVKKRTIQNKQKITGDHGNEHELWSFIENMLTSQHLFLLLENKNNITYHKKL